MPKILVVEDEKLLREALRLKLTKEGFAVIEASDGEEGLSRALNEKPELMLLDLNLPKLNGIEVLKALRADERGKDLQVIVLSNAKDPVVVDDTEKYGARAFLVKTDWELEGITEMIKIALGQ